MSRTLEGGSVLKLRPLRGSRKALAALAAVVEPRRRRCGSDAGRCWHPGGAITCAVEHRGDHDDLAD